MCVRDAYPPPHLEQTLDRLAGAKYFSSLDAEKGYYQINMTERAKKLSAFRCPFGFFQFVKMPFGLMNAGAVFQRTMAHILKDLMWKCCMVYVDDIVVFSTTWEEHMTHVDAVLTALRDAGLTLNFKKCELGRDELLYLGFVISAAGIRPNPAKVAAIKAFAVPGSKTEVRSFLGATGQFRKFIRNYGMIARPLTRICGENAGTLWKGGTAMQEEQRKAFRALQELGSSDEVFKYPDYRTPFLLVCDA